MLFILLYFSAITTVVPTTMETTTEPTKPSLFQKDMVILEAEEETNAKPGVASSSSHSSHHVACVAIVITLLGMVCAIGQF